MLRESAQEEQRQADGDQGQRPGDERPTGVRFLDQADGGVEEGEEEKAETLKSGEAEIAGRTGAT
jgi:hypothetical protein